MALAALGPLAGGATVGLAALLAGAMPTASRRLARAWRHGANQTMLCIADQVTTPGLFQCFAHELVVLGLAILDERALHGLLVRVACHIDRLHGAWVHAGVVHAGRHGGRRGVEVLHLLGHIAHVAHGLGKVHSFLHGRAGMARD